jgi:hypothetical protein
MLVFQAVGAACWANMCKLIEPLMIRLIWIEFTRVGKWSMIGCHSPQSVLSTLAPCLSRLLLFGLYSYPASVGRNMDEIVRVVDALLLSAEKSVATPANWPNNHADQVRAQTGQPCLSQLKTFSWQHMPCVIPIH